jgi:hypothetical protein
MPINPILLQLAPNAMSTPESIRAYKNIPDNDNYYDIFLVMLINYASAWIERVTGRRFGLARYAELVKGSGWQELTLQNYPIRIIHSISDTDGGVIDPVSYLFDTNGQIGVVYNDRGWRRKAYPTGLVPDYVLTKAYLRADYTAGYVLPKDVTDETPPDWILPADIQGIIWQIADQELALSQNTGLSAFSISDVSWTFDKNPRQQWLDVMNLYKAW